MALLRSRKRKRKQDLNLSSGSEQASKRRRSESSFAPTSRSVSEDRPSEDRQTESEFNARCILKETDDKYLIDWEDDSQTGAKYSPTWEPKENASSVLRANWEASKLSSIKENRKRSYLGKPAPSTSQPGFVSPAVSIPKRPRGRPRKNPVQTETAVGTSGKRPRGRPRKNPVQVEPIPAASLVAKKSKGRPSKTYLQTGSIPETPQESEELRKRQAQQTITSSGPKNLLGIEGATNPTSDTAEFDIHAPRRTVDEKTASPSPSLASRPDTYRSSSLLPTLEESGPTSPRSPSSQDSPLRESLLDSIECVRSSNEEKVIPDSQSVPARASVAVVAGVDQKSVGLAVEQESAPVFTDSKPQEQADRSTTEFFALQPSLSIAFSSQQVLTIQETPQNKEQEQSSGISKLQDTSTSCTLTSSEGQGIDGITYSGSDQGEQKRKDSARSDSLNETYTTSSNPHSERLSTDDRSPEKDITTEGSETVAFSLSTGLSQNPEETNQQAAQVVPAYNLYSRSQEELHSISHSQPKSGNNPDISSSAIEKGSTQRENDLLDRTKSQSQSEHSEKTPDEISDATIQEVATPADQGHQESSLLPDPGTVAGTSADQSIRETQLEIGISRQSHRVFKKVFAEREASQIENSEITASAEARDPAELSLAAAVPALQEQQAPAEPLLGRSETDSAGPGSQQSGGEQVIESTTVDSVLKVPPQARASAVSDLASGDHEDPASQQDERSTAIKSRDQANLSIPKSDEERAADLSLDRAKTSRRPKSALRALESLLEGRKAAVQARQAQSSSYNCGSQANQNSRGAAQEATPFTVLNAKQEDFAHRAQVGPIVVDGSRAIANSRDRSSVSSQTNPSAPHTHKNETRPASSDRSSSLTGEHPVDTTHRVKSERPRRKRLAIDFPEVETKRIKTASPTFTSRELNRDTGPLKIGNGGGPQLVRTPIRVSSPACSPRTKDILRVKSQNCESSCQKENPFASPLLKASEMATPLRSTDPQSMTPSASGDTPTKLSLREQLRALRESAKARRAQRVSPGLDLSLSSSNNSPSVIPASYAPSQPPVSMNARLPTLTLDKPASPVINPNIHESSSNQTTKTEADFLIEPLLSTKEYIVALSMGGSTAELYKDTIVYHRELIEKYMDTEDPALLEKVNDFVQTLNQITTHSDLVNPGTATQLQVAPSDQAKWDQTCSPKFLFLGRLLGRMKQQLKHVVIVAMPGRTLDILQTFLIGIGVSFSRADRVVRTAAKGCALRVSLLPSSGVGSNMLLERAALIIALDHTFAAQENVQGFRKHVTNPNYTTPIISLAVMNSAEHVERCIAKDPDLSESERLKILIRAVAHLRQHVGKLPVKFPRPTSAAEIVFKYISAEDDRGIEWELPPIGGIKSLFEDSQLNLPLKSPSSVRAPDGQHQKRHMVGLMHYFICVKLMIIGARRGRRTCKEGPTDAANSFRRT